jgi:uncharacterized pyridoxamine 5'-phosphate oxidase family protein
MKEVIKLLAENPMGFLATVENGEPRVRPWGFMFEENGKFYFCTNNTKDVYRQLQANPFIEFSTRTDKFVWVRLRGKVIFAEDMRIKEKTLAGNELVKSIYKSADNPIFKTFYIEHGSAIIGDFSGQPPRQFTF